MMKDFYNNEHADNRLSRCYCIFKKEDTICCEQIDSATKNLIHVDGHSFDINSEDICYMFDTLGYAQSKGMLQPIYFSRVAQRMWKVGVCNNNTSKNHLFNEWDGVPHRNMPLNEALIQIYTNNYPKFDVALNNIRRGNMAAQAFSKVFAVGVHKDTMSPVIYYKNTPIAFVNDENIVEMGDVNAHLREQLEAALGKECLI